jgi:hypothetical protein
MVLKVEVLSLTDTGSGKRSVIIRRDKLSESKVGGAYRHGEKLRLLIDICHPCC